jgi:transposase
LVFERVQIKALLVSVPDTLCSKYGGLSNVILVTTLEHTRPAGAVTDPDVATAITLKNLADRYGHLAEEINTADAALE